jgi:hypothetical protein
MNDENDMLGLDIFAYETVEAMSEPGCPMCRVMQLEDIRDMASFVREGWQDSRTARRFLLGGGFCGHHAWLFHALSAEARSGVAIAHLYGIILDQDLEAGEQAAAWASGGRRSGVVAKLRRRSGCLACERAKQAVSGHALFLVDALDSPKVRSRYTSSDGPCYTHFTYLLEEALTRKTDVALFILDDWRRRLRDLSHNLANYNLKRDYRYAAQRTAAEQESWTEVIRRYAGEPPVSGRSRGST